jgi:CO dehydrogenase maturation factor
VRVAVAGKGGAGKTTITATLARTMASGGRTVVAVDADSNPNLGVALGASGGGQPVGLPPSLVSRRFDGPHLTEPVDDVLDRCSLIAPDGVRLLTMGMPAHAEEGCLCGAHATVSALLGDLGERAHIVTLVDLEASPEHLSRGTARHADVLALVAEPYYRSLETVRRLASLAAELPIPHVVVIVNKVRSAADHDAVVEFCDRHGLRWLGDVPWSDEVTDADRVRVPLIDRSPDAPVVAAVAHLADELLALDAPRSEVGA